MSWIYMRIDFMVYITDDWSDCLLILSTDTFIFWHIVGTHPKPKQFQSTFLGCCNKLSYLSTCADFYRLFLLWSDTIDSRTPKSQNVCEWKVNLQCSSYECLYRFHLLLDKIHLIYVLRQSLFTLRISLWQCVTNNIIFGLANTKCYK